MFASSEPTPSSSRHSGIHPALQHSPSPSPTHRSTSTSRQQKYRAEQSISSPKMSPTARRPKTSALATSTEPHATPGGQGSSNGQLSKSNVKKMARQFATRLQFAAFKVERGWTKHSLSEVENLYWRASRTNGASNQRPAEARRSSQKATRDVTQSALLPAMSTYPTTAATNFRLNYVFWAESTANKRAKLKTSGESRANDGEDIFGGPSIAFSLNRSTGQATFSRAPTAQSEFIYQPPLPTSQLRRQSVVIDASGLPTPPPSAGAESALSSNSAAKMNPSTLRVSPTRTVQILRAQSASDVSASHPTASSPLGPSIAPSKDVGASYADFWNKLGSLDRDQNCGLARAPFPELTRAGTASNEDSANADNPTDAPIEDDTQTADDTTHRSKKRGRESELDGDSLCAVRTLHSRISEGPLEHATVLAAFSAGVRSQ